MGQGVRISTASALALTALIALALVASSPGPEAGAATSSGSYDCKFRAEQVVQKQGELTARGFFTCSGSVERQTLRVCLLQEAASGAFRKVECASQGRSGAQSFTVRAQSKCADGPERTFISRATVTLRPASGPSQTRTADSQAATFPRSC